MSAGAGVAARVVDVALGALFVLTAYLQLNDPDPTYWVVLYGAVALVAFLRAAGRRWLLLVAGALAVCLVHGLYRLPEAVTLVTRDGFGGLTRSMSAGDPLIEHARESLGLLVAAAALIYIGLRSRPGYRWRGAWRPERLPGDGQA